MCRWFITGYFIHNLYGAGKGNRKDCVGGNAGGLFGCFVSQFFTWNDRITKEPLNEDGRRNGVNETRIEEVRGFDQMRASRNDLLSVQRSIVVEGRLALVGAQDNADSMAAAFSL